MHPYFSLKPSLRRTVLQNTCQTSGQSLHWYNAFLRIPHHTSAPRAPVYPQGLPDPGHPQELPIYFEPILQSYVSVLLINVCFPQYASMITISLITAYSQTGFTWLLFTPEQASPGSSLFTNGKDLSYLFVSFMLQWFLFGDRTPIL